MGKDWETLNTEELLQRQREQREQHEQTTSAGVGGFAVPIGKPLRRQVPVAPVPPPEPVESKPSKTKQKKDR